MCIGNNIGFVYDSDFSLDEMFGYSYGSFIIELSDAKAGDIPDNIICRVVGKTVCEPYVSWEDSKIPLCNMLSLYEGGEDPETVKKIKISFKCLRICKDFSGTISTY